MLLLDTTFWIDLATEKDESPRLPFAQRGPAHRFVTRNRAEVFSISIITWGVLAVGYAHSMDLERVLGRTKVLSLPRQVAWEASRLDKELPQRLGENDNWITATARIWGLRLVSRDAAFGRVPRLRVVRY